jgi:hypothetical protein
MTTVLAAIEGSGGVVQKVAEELSCDWHTARRYINRWTKTRELFQGELNEALDLAESQLFEAVKRGESWAIKLLLMTKGKRRGYTLRMEHGGEGGGTPIQARFVAPKCFKSADEWQRYAREHLPKHQDSSTENSDLSP